MSEIYKIKIPSYFLHLFTITNFILFLTACSCTICLGHIEILLATGASDRIARNDFDLWSTLNTRQLYINPKLPAANLFTLKVHIDSRFRWFRQKRTVGGDQKLWNQVPPGIPRGEWWVEVTILQQLLHKVYEDYNLWRSHNLQKTKSAVTVNYDH